MRITSAKALARLVRQARLRQGLTQSEVGRLVGMKQATVSAFENHPEQARLETLFRLLSALGLELDLAERGGEGRAADAWDEEW